MALIVSAASGNFNAGATWVGGVVPGVGDEAQAANGHTITITANANCDLVSNTGTGIFTLNSGVTLTANVTNKTTTQSRNCVQFTAAGTAYIVGNITGGSTIACGGVLNSNTGNLIITGNCVGGSGGFGSPILGCFGVSNPSTGVVSITGNCVGGSGGFSHGIQNSSTGSIQITGNATGGSNTGVGAYNNSTGTVTVTGNVNGGTVVTSSHGLNNAATGICDVVGICTGGTTASGANNASTGTIRATRAVGNAYGPGNSAGLTAAVGASNAGLGVIETAQIEYGTYGMSPTSGTGIRLKKANTNVAVFNYADSAGAKTLIDATQNAAMPAANHVRSGVSYASGALTGTCAVPAAGSVALGVPVDNTTGTAALTPASVWEYATRTLTAGAGISAADVWSHASRTVTGGTVTTLTNAPTVPSASAIADEVWNRQASAITTTNSIGERVKNTATTAIVGNLLAQANS